MTMRPRVRTFALTVHVISSVGWLGAVACSLVLAIVGLTSQDGQRIRAVYLTLDVMGWFVLVPLSFASLLTGLIQSLGTPWGLFRHYWVIAKLLINVVATTILLLYTQTLGSLAAAAAAAVAFSDVLALRNLSPVIHAAAALVALLVATVLSIYKPRGLTQFGWRKQEEQRHPAQR